MLKYINMPPCHPDSTRILKSININSLFMIHLTLLDNVLLFVIFIYKGHLIMVSDVFFIYMCSHFIYKILFLVTLCKSKFSFVIAYILCNRIL